uniref:Uncharacterized protein n=1 Tax=Magallana gigas TaxID=29159 RepID=A0A8W8MKR3_MAGGI
MIARDTGRLIVLSAFVALCAIVLFSSETEAKGYGDVSPYKGSVKRGGGKYFPGVPFKKRGNRKGYGKGRGLGNKIGRRYYGLRKRGKGGKYRGLWKGSRKNNKVRRRGYGGRKGKRYGGKSYRGKGSKGYPKKKDENC